MIPYTEGPFNEISNGVQRVRITDGCPNTCPFCYAPKEHRFYGIPKITEKDVQILDMNLLSHPDSRVIIEKLGETGSRFELVCGMDYRFLDDDVAAMLKMSRFVNPRFAWDGPFRLQHKMKDAVRTFLKAGYLRRDLSCFVLCNYLIPIDENLKKLDLLKVWNVKVCDCYYDGQVFPNVRGIYWTDNECKRFRRTSRIHNLMVMFGLDPEARPFEARKKQKRISLDSL